MTDLQASTARLVAWTKNEALPMWARRARDHRGGFYEALLMDGSPCTNLDKRFRVQPRQAYVYAHAHDLGWTEVGRGASDHAWSYALTVGSPDDSLYADDFFTGFCHVLTPEGEVRRNQRDTYDHAFVMLAAAWRQRAFADDEAALIVDRTLTFLASLEEPDGSYREGHPAVLPRRQNPHMHLFEANLALHHAGFDGALDRARKMRRLLTNHFWDGTVLREFFNGDWSPHPEKGNIAEPGHMAEWAWLLGAFEEATGEDQSPLIDALYAAAERYGRDPGGSPFLIDEAFASGQPSRTTRRTWVQTEYIKATLMLARRGTAGAADKAAMLITAMLESYLDADLPGGWNDQYHQDGTVVSTNMATSTFYHVLSMAAEADRTVRALG